MPPGRRGTLPTQSALNELSHVGVAVGLLQSEKVLRARPGAQGSCGRDKRRRVRAALNHRVAKCAACAISHEYTLGASNFGRRHRDAVLQPLSWPLGSRFSVCPQVPSHLASLLTSSRRWSRFALTCSHRYSLLPADAVTTPVRPWSERSPPSFLPPLAELAVGAARLAWPLDWTRRFAPGA
jgi:hypothetical protein